MRTTGALTQKGYVLVLWVAIFAALAVALAIVQTTLKRGLSNRATATVDYLLWRQWSVNGQPQEPQLEPPEQNIRSKTVVPQERQFAFTNETHDEIRYGTNASKESLQLSIGVEEENQDFLIEDYNLNENFFVEGSS